MKKKKNSLIYDWSVKDYVRFVENSHNPLMKGYENAELEYLKTEIKNTGAKTFVDLGAGYGRVIPALAKLSKNVIGIEINENMFEELKNRVGKYSNATAIKGDANDLSTILKKVNMTSPVLTCLQNSLGTWEGDYKKALFEMAEIAKQNKGEIIISGWRGEQFSDFSIDIYSAIAPVTGEPDLEKSDFENKIFRSKTGYISKWWPPKERKEIIEMLGGKTVKETLRTPYFILHVNY